MILNIGYSNYINLDRVIAILNPDSSPIKRMIKEAKETDMLIDATYGRKTRSVIVLDSKHLVLSSFQSDTLKERIENKWKVN